MTNHGTTVLSDPVHANTSMFFHTTSVSSCLELVVNVAPIVTYCFRRPLPELLFDLRITCSLSWTFSLYVDAIVLPFMNLAPSPDKFVHHARPSFFKRSLDVSFLPYHIYDLHTVPSLVPISLIKGGCFGKLTLSMERISFGILVLWSMLDEFILCLLEKDGPFPLTRPEKGKGFFAFVRLVRLGCRVPRMAPNVKVNLRRLRELDKSFSATYKLLRNSSGESRPDFSFDKSASLERLFCLAHVSLAENPSKNKEPTHLKRSRRLEDLNTTKENARRERSKPRRKRSRHQETSSYFEYEEGLDDAFEDLNSPYKRSKPTHFTQRITHFKYHKRAKLPWNIRVYEGNKDSEDHLGGAARNWFDDLNPKSVDSFEEQSQKLLEEFLKQKRYAKDLTETHGIKRRSNEGEWGYAESRINHYEYSCDELALIRRIFFAGYDV
nr:reverse transcriptase domain-containing protein [Tanacetum cinerariifolium]